MSEISTISSGGRARQKRSKARSNTVISSRSETKLAASAARKSSRRPTSTCARARFASIAWLKPILMPSSFKTRLKASTFGTALPPAGEKRSTALEICSFEISMLQAG
jgi:hypothetical protein